MSILVPISLVLTFLVIFTSISDVIATDNDFILLNLPGQGPIQGLKSKTSWTNQTILQFLSIPFAESPSGDLRFKAPVARAPWNQVHDGTKFGFRCPELLTVKKLSAEERNRDLEDCLHLSVYTKNTTAKRPVMFYVYGGGFTNGSASDFLPNYLLEKDIVLVVIQYRVGAVGWLATNTKEMPGNVPVLDVILALQWVQKHIPSFGGDPSQVTIFSQSAGATITGMIVLSPITPPGLFQRVIIQSGSPFCPWATNSRPLEKTKSICRKLCSSCEEIKEMHECLQKVSILKILEETSEDTFSMTLNDYHGMIPLIPPELMKQYSRSYSIMTGATKHEGSYVLAVFYDALKKSVENISYVSPRTFSSKLFDITSPTDPAGLGSNLITALLYNSTDLDGIDNKKLIPAYIDQASDVSFKSPILTFAKEIYKKNCSSFLYSFDYEGQWTRFGYEFGNEHYPFNGGIHHSNDNIYLFPSHKLNEKDTKFSKKMIDLWTSFAINGMPSTDGAPNLLPLKNEAGPYFHIDEKISIGSDYFEELKAAVNDPNKEALIREGVEF